jgi:hypothetical protein
MIFIKTSIFLIFHIVSCIGLGGLVLLARPFAGLHKIHASATRFLLTSYILGFSLYSFVFLLIALAGLFYKEVVLLLILPAYVYVILSLRRKLLQAGTEFGRFLGNLRDLDLAWKVIAMVCLGFLILTLTTFARPLSGDGAQVYMPWAKIIAASHHLLTVPGYVDYSVPGLFTEMHYAVFMSFDVREAGRLNDLVFTAGIIGMLLLIGRSLGIKKEGFWALIAFLFTSPVFIWLVGKGTSDLAPGLLGLAAVYLIIPEERDFETPLYALAGFFCGLAVYAKVSYLIAFLPVLAVIVLFRFFAQKRKPIFKQFWSGLFFKACLALGIGVLIGIAPFIIKNTYIFGSPFTAPEGSLSNYSFNSETQVEYMGGLLRSLPLSLFYGLNDWKSGRLSPLILAFLPLCLFTGFFKKRFDSNLLLQVTLAGIVGFMLWVLLRPASFLMRYFLATILLFVFLPAWSLEQIWQKAGYSGAKVVIGILIPVMMFSEFSGDIGTFFLPKETAQYIRGTVGECEKDGYHCIGLKTINREAKPGDRVLFADWFGYWLRPDLLQCMVTKADRQVYQLIPVSRSLPVDTFGLTRVPTFNDLWKEIYERGFTYIVRTKKPDANASQLDLTRMGEVPWVRLVDLYNNDYLEVYRIEYNNPPYTVKAVCTETSPGYWQLMEK